MKQFTILLINNLDYTDAESSERILGGFKKNLQDSYKEGFTIERADSAGDSILYILSKEV
jgi:hypothetical protein